MTPAGETFVPGMIFRTMQALKEIMAYIQYNFDSDWKIKSQELVWSLFRLKSCFLEKSQWNDSEGSMQSSFGNSPIWKSPGWNLVRFSTNRGIKLDLSKYARQLYGEWISHQSVLHESGSEAVHSAFRAWKSNWFMQRVSETEINPTLGVAAVKDVTITWIIWGTDIRHARTVKWHKM